MSSSVPTDLSDKKPGLGTAALALLVFLAAGGVVLLFLLLGRGEAKYDAERATKRLENLAALREANAKVVNDYAVLDREKGIYQLPIARAVELTALDLARIEPKVAYPVATPIPPVDPAADAPPAADAAAEPAAPAASPEPAAAASAPDAGAAQPTPADAAKPTISEAAERPPGEAPTPSRADPNAPPAPTRPDAPDVATPAVTP